MANQKSIVLYDWMPFFKGVVDALRDIGRNKNTRDKEIRSAAEKVFGNIINILEYQFIDPLSFVYSLCCVDKRQHKYFPCIENAKEYFDIEQSQWPFTDFYYPHARANNLYFHAGGSYVVGDESPDEEKNKTALNEVWKLFNDAVDANTYKEILDNRFSDALKRPLFGLAKFTHILFLINPKVFLPIDDRTRWLPLGKPWSSEQSQKKLTKNIENGTYKFSEIMETYIEVFVGCAPYEINRFAFLLESKELSLKDTIWVCATSPEGKGEKDYCEDFSDKNYVSVGSPLYTVTKPKRGDIIIARTGKSEKLLGVVLENGYREGWEQKANISTIWIVKSNNNPFINKKAKQFAQKAFYKYGGKIEFREKTERLIDKIKQKQKEKIDKIKMEKMKFYYKYIELLQEDKNLILQGAPGVGKTYIASFIAMGIVDSHTIDKEPEEIIEAYQQAIKDGYIVFTTFHQSMDYEEFIEGWRPCKNSTDGMSYVIRSGIFKKLCERAKRTEDGDSEPKNYVLIIDEINRGNISKIFGELITLLEKDKRLDENNEVTVTLPYSEETFNVPSNLYIIGTMNTADRSLEYIDYAVRRRFVFATLKSEKEKITEYYKEKDQECGEVAKNLFDEIHKIFFTEVNDAKNIENIIADVDPADIMIGHSYFMAESREALERNLKYQIKPLLQEYVKDGILAERVKDYIEALSLSS